MVRTEREKARERSRKYDDVTTDSLFEAEQLEEIDSLYREEHAARCRAALVRGRRGGRQRWARS